MVFKLRSMYQDAEARKAELMRHNEMDGGVLFKVQRDPRITRLGRWLRRLSIDEMPQLLNVLRGEMSLVGPRPLVLPESALLGDSWHARRLDLRPGLTGPWQISGRSDLTVQDMVRLDYQYVTGWSFDAGPGDPARYRHGRLERARRVLAPRSRPARRQTEDNPDARPVVAPPTPGAAEA